MSQLPIRSDQQIADLEMKMFSAIAGREPVIGPPLKPPPTRFSRASDTVLGWCAKRLPPPNHPAMKRLVDAKQRLTHFIHA